MEDITAAIPSGKTASIQTRTMEVKVMKVDNRQFTLSVLRQLPERPFHEKKNDGSLVRKMEGVQLWGKVKHDTESFCRWYCIFAEKGELCKWQISQQDRQGCNGLLEEDKSQYRATLMIETFEIQQKMEGIADRARVAAFLDQHHNEVPRFCYEFNESWDRGGKIYNLYIPGFLNSKSTLFVNWSESIKEFPGYEPNRSTTKDKANEVIDYYLKNFFEFDKKDFELALKRRDNEIPERNNNLELSLSALDKEILGLPQIFIAT